MNNYSSNGWKISIKDGDHYFSNKRSQKNWEKYHNNSKENIEIIKRKIIERHQRLGLDENIKKEMYPSLFK